MTTTELGRHFLRAGSDVGEQRLTLSSSDPACGVEYSSRRWSLPADQPSTSTSMEPPTRIRIPLHDATGEEEHLRAWSASARAAHLSVASMSLIGRCEPDQAVRRWQNAIRCWREERCATAGQARVGGIVVERGVFFPGVLMGASVLAMIFDAFGDELGLFHPRRWELVDDAELPLVGLRKNSEPIFLCGNMHCNENRQDGGRMNRRWPSARLSARNRVQCVGPG